MRAMMSLVLSVAALLVLAPFAASDTIRADRSDSSYLGLGALPQYAAVGRLDIKARNGNFIGSGTLIAPDWVITAAHCLDKVKSLQFSVAGTTYTASSWVAYPTWKGNLAAGDDIGLVHLSASVPGVTPAQRYTGSAELGKAGTFVGYGMTGTGLTGATIFDGQKRGAQNVIDAYYPVKRSVNTRILMADFDNPDPKKASDSHYGSSTPIDLEGLIAPGDSGGGLFIDVAGLTFLAGVNSFGMAWDGKVDSDYGDASGDTRVSAFNAWIDSVVGHYLTAPLTATDAAADSGADQAPSFNAIPEPASMSLLALGGILLIRRRRR